MTSEPITAAEKLACAERELKVRQRAYPGRVQRRRMTAAKAAHELACMAAIAEDYRAAVEMGDISRETENCFS